MPLSNQFLHPESFEGNRVLTVQYTSASSSAHQVFFQPHRVKQEATTRSELKPAGRTLFVSNVPTWANRAAVKRLFQCNGPVEEVYLQRHPSAGKPPRQERDAVDAEGGEADVGAGFRYAYVVYERPSGVQNAMKKMDLSRPRPLYEEAKRPETGLEKWRQDYNDSIVTDLAALMADVESRVAETDRAREEAERADEEAAVEDEDGWVTVSRTTAKKASKVGKISDKSQAKVKAREARKRKRKELENFYKFQAKESKLRRMEELKEKFEADKRRQLAMKQERKFRPV